MTPEIQLAQATLNLFFGWGGDWPKKDRLRIEAREAARAASGVKHTHREWEAILVEQALAMEIIQKEEQFDGDVSKAAYLLESLANWEREWARTLPLAYIGVLKTVQGSTVLENGLKVKQCYVDKWEKARLQVFVHDEGAIRFLSNQHYDVYEARVKWEQLMPRNAPGESLEIPPAIAIYDGDVIKPLQIGKKVT